MSTGLRRTSQRARFVARVGGGTVRRRDVLAGLASAGVLAGAGVLLSRGPPTPATDSEPAGSDSEDESNGVARPPFEIETIDAPGSEAGTLTVPQPETVMVIDFFQTTCATCAREMETLGAARAAVGDDVVFLSMLAYGRVGTPEAVREWWIDNDGDWPVGIQVGDELQEYYGVFRYPKTIVIDGAGRKHWDNFSEKTVDELLEAIDAAREAQAANTERTDE